MSIYYSQLDQLFPLIHLLHVKLKKSSQGLVEDPNRPLAILLHIGVVRILSVNKSIFSLQPIYKI